MLHNEQTEQQGNLNKLCKMRVIATALLVCMALIYLVFKRLETRGLLFSSVRAFSEAAMIGALADWFAVVALFRHPLGLKWIPHTAIIQNNKDRIGESISNFVVSNFFTEEVIKSRLDRIELASEFASYLKKNKESISKSILAGLPGVIKAGFEHSELKSLAEGEIKKGLGRIRLYPLLGGILKMFVSSGQHIPITKELLVYLYNYISDNKEAALRFLESLNKTLVLPVIGDIVYKNILKSISKQMEDIEGNNDSEARRLLMYSLPMLAERLKTSEELIAKGEKYKSEIIYSEQLKDLIGKLLDQIRDILLSYAQSSAEELEKKLEALMDRVTCELLENEKVVDKINGCIKSIVVNVICTYKDEIAKLIRHTVDEWETEDMVRKLEVQVGADLQYIRINGTVIGGLAGLTIHLLSHFI